MSLAEEPDFVLPFRIEGQNVNGRIVRLNNLAGEVLGRHDYPEPVSRLLAETLVLTAMLGSMLKFDGRFIFQIQGNGPMSMMMADYSIGGALRGCAQYDADSLSALVKQAGASTALFGDKGHIALTVDQGHEMERYQGIVPLEGTTLAEAALGYFERSEQIATRLKLAAAPLLLPGGRTEWRAGGILLQQEGAEGGFSQDNEGESPSAMSPAQAEDEWNRLCMLLDTTEDTELLDQELSAEALAYRLFHEDGVRAFTHRPMHFACPCSRERVLNMLVSLPSDDSDDLQARAEIEVRCEFCNELYSVAPEEVAARRAQHDSAPSVSK